MADFIPILAQQSRLSQIPITQGQLIFVFDAGTVYVDYANQRHLMAGGSSGGGLNRVIVSQSQSAQPGNWYICVQPVTITLPSVHQQGDLVKVSTTLGVQAVSILPATDQSIESDSGFLLDMDITALHLVWNTDRWKIAELTSRTCSAPTQTQQQQPTVSNTIAYYGVINDNQTYAVSQITQSMLTQLTPLQLEQDAVVDVAIVPGSVTCVLLPHGYTAYKDDGFGGQVPFQLNNGVTGTGANGTVVTLGGNTYKSYGQFNVVTGNTIIYIQQEL